MVYRLEKIKATKSNVKNTPHEPGIYVYWDESKPIYIGKSISLRNRLESYFGPNLETKTATMMSEAKYFSTVVVPSEIEALLLESTLIKKYQPRFNRALKDDKHPLYIVITKDEFPRVITARKSELQLGQEVFGPFPSSSNVKFVLKMLRSVFPYSSHLPGKRVCIYRQMNLCKPCPTEIALEKDVMLKKKLKKEYIDNVRNMKGILSGRFTVVRKKLAREMEAFAKAQKYESAAEVREKIRRLDYITTHPPSVSRFMENPNLIEDLREGEVNELTDLLKKYIKVDKLKRIECFDVAHIAGASPTASMVTFIDAIPEKAYYRHFRIKKAKGGDDVGSLSEVAKRRAKRLSDWGVPDLIIADGGRTQTKAFVDQFARYGIPVVGLAKRFETLVIPTSDGFTEVRPTGKALALVTRIRDEAHRFARRYHHKLFKNYLLATRH